VVGVQADEDALVAVGHGVHAGDDLGVDGGALDQLDAVGHRVGFDGGAVVGADVDVDVDADDLALGLARVERLALFERDVILPSRMRSY
jgi:hypothetical protein